MAERERERRRDPNIPAHSQRHIRVPWALLPFHLGGGRGERARERESGDCGAERERVRVEDVEGLNLRGRDVNER